MLKNKLRARYPACKRTKSPGAWLPPVVAPQSVVGWWALPQLQSRQPMAARVRLGARAIGGEQFLDEAGRAAQVYPCGMQGPQCLHAGRIDETEAR